MLYQEVPGGQSPVIRPLIRKEISRSGVQLLPMFLFLSFALGFLVIGQTAVILKKLGAFQYIGTVMVVVVVRELWPLLAAVMVLARVGTANVIELGNGAGDGRGGIARGAGHRPGALSGRAACGRAGAGDIFALTVYLIIGARSVGNFWLFIQEVPLKPGDYFEQLATSLTGLDFALLALKTCAFGSMIAIVTCYHGLAQPLRLEEVSRATVRAVAQSIIGFVILDALFILVYLLTQ